MGALDENTYFLMRVYRIITHHWVQDEKERKRKRQGQQGRQREKKEQRYASLITVWQIVRSKNLPLAVLLRYPLEPELRNQGLHLCGLSIVHKMIVGGKLLY